MLLCETNIDGTTAPYIVVRPANLGQLTLLAPRSTTAANV